MTEDEIKQTFQNVLEAQGRGAFTRAATVLGINRASLTMMLNGASKLPLPRAVQLARHLGLSFELITLEPDISLQPRKQAQDPKTLNT